MTKNTFFDIFKSTKKHFLTFSKVQKFIFCNFKNGKKLIFAPKKNLKQCKMPFFGLKKRQHSLTKDILFSTFQVIVHQVTIGPVVMEVTMPMEVPWPVRWPQIPVTSWLATFVVWLFRLCRCSIIISKAQDIYERLNLNRLISKWRLPECPLNKTQEKYAVRFAGYRWIHLISYKLI